MTRLCRTQTAAATRACAPRHASILVHAAARASTQTWIRLSPDRGAPIGGTGWPPGVLRSRYYDGAGAAALPLPERPAADLGAVDRGQSRPGALPRRHECRSRLARGTTLSPGDHHGAAATAGPAW